MNYSQEEVLQLVKEDDVKFIRLSFCDIFGRPKNVTIMPGELERAFSDGIAFDASAIAGFGGEVHSDLLLHPDPDTITIMPWRPEHGRVVRMFCNISYPDGAPFEADSRAILQNAVRETKEAGISFAFGSELEFYLFKRDENGDPTKIPYDDAGYMDIAPQDKGENVRREICLMLEQMGIRPESAHHEEGPGQNEVDFRYSDPLTAADEAMTFQSIVDTIAAQNNLSADFSPKPLKGKPGNGFHINISVKGTDQKDHMGHMIAGILEKISDMTVFLNPAENSYARFGASKAPRYISWSSQNRSQLIRIPAAVGDYRRTELRSPDPLANPYLAFAILIHAGLYGIRRGLELPPPADLNLYTADPEILKEFRTLPKTLGEAQKAARESRFLAELLPETVLKAYCGEA